MVIVKISRDKNGLIKKFTLRGHANANVEGKDVFNFAFKFFNLTFEWRVKAELKQKDIVCSGVSAIVFTALGSLEELAGIKNNVLDDGCIEFSLPENIEGERLEKAEVILKVMVIGLKMIKGNPSYEKYISIADEEV